MKSYSAKPVLHSRPLPILMMGAIAFAASLLASNQSASGSLPTTAKPAVIVDTKAEPVEAGPFQPNWQSIEQYKCPDWFRDAKFGIWAHWGPQCQPGDGDWYARHMYIQDGWQYQLHLTRYGHPSEFGFKDIINSWKAEKWDPDKLVALYKRVGAHYFFALANHHDNFDLWDSKYQPWNSAAIGPKKDLIAGWAKAAHAQGLPFGVSVHAAHAWSWYEPSQGADQKGPKAGVPYDGKLTKADGKGKWWEGLDPQDLYAQQHQPSPDFEKANSIYGRWDWGNGVSQPDQAYCQKFYNRTAELIRKYQPDLIYFDDTLLPLWPVSDAGLKIAADFYNSNLAKTKGKSEGVLFGKILEGEELKAMVWDIERGIPNGSLPYAWQTDTCLGDWHYNRSIYEQGLYKNAATVIHMLADIVSKNGNLLLNVPLCGDGSPDEKEVAILENIASWMEVNKECIFSTRPWKVFGEGPACEGSALMSQGFNEGKGKPFTAQDIRFTAKGDTLYAIVLGIRNGPISIHSFGKSAALLDRKIVSVQQLGSSSLLQWKQQDDALVITPLPVSTPVQTVVFKLLTR